MEQRPIPNTLCKSYSKTRSKSLLLFSGSAAFPAAADSALTSPELQLRSYAGDSDTPIPITTALMLWGKGTVEWFPGVFTPDNLHLADQHVSYLTLTTSVELLTHCWSFLYTKNSDPNS